MPKLAVACDFLPGYAALEKSVRRKVDELFGKFVQHTHAGLHLEKPEGARDPRTRTIRIDDNYRGVVMAPESGDVYLLVKVLKHDEAYEWVERHRFEVNAATGALEVADVVAVEDAVSTLSSIPIPAGPAPLLAVYTIKDIVRLGIDEKLAAVVRRLTTEEELDALTAVLPQGQAVALQMLAAGYSVDEAWAELVAGEEPRLVDTEDIEAALERPTSKSMFYVASGADDLLDVLNRPVDLWRTFLQPSTAPLDDVARVAECCAALPPATAVYEYDDFVTNLLLTVLDYMQHTTAVERAIAFYKENRYESIRTLDDLKRTLDGFADDQEGNTDLALFLWDYKLWTRSAQLRALVTFLESIGVTTQEALRSWAERAEFSRDFEGRVKGLGIAVFNWLTMRLGVDTAKPDVRVRRFVEDCLGHPAGADEHLVSLVAGAAGAIGRSVRDLDWAIWEHMGSAPRPDARPASNPPLLDQPGQAVVVEDGDGVPVAFHRDEGGYLAWLAAHPGGFVLACDPKPRARETRLHTARCSTISRKRPPGSMYTDPYMKVCAPTREAIVAWTIATTSESPRLCKTCRP